MNKQQLAAKIWASANKMRSNKIEVQDYKDYILGFIFYKYLSDTEVKKLRELGMSDEDMKSQLKQTNKDILKYCKDNFGYFIAYENLFSTWLGKKSDFTVKNVSTALSAFSRNVNNTYKSVFKGVFTTLETGLSKLGESTGSQTKAISELIHLIKDIPTDDRQGYDVLGFIYEYLISNFAASAGKKAGEFYTPHEVAVLMSEIVAEHLKDRDHIDIYDPTSGSGSLLITIGRAVGKYLKGKNKVRYYAQELKEATYNLTRMNLVMRGIEPDNIITRNADTLGQDWPMITERGTYNLLRVDAVVSNPPYSQGWDVKAGDPRFKMGLAPKAKADYAFLLHSLYHLEPDGIMTIVLPTGVLSREEEREIRKNLIENGHIESIIALPQNMFFGADVSTIIMVLRQKREADDVLFINATKCCTRIGKKNVLRTSDIRRITDAVRERTSKPHFCELVSKEVIREENDYNLYIPRYVDSAEPAEVEDLYAHIFGGVPNAELRAFDEEWAKFPTLHDELFATDDSPYATVKSRDIPTTIADNADVETFTDRYHTAFDGFDALLKERLIDSMDNVDTPNELIELSGEVFGRVEPFAPIVDKYNVYQILDNHWTGIATDIEIIQTEGFDATRQVDPDIQIKTKKDGTEEEVNKGWMGHVIPFPLVQSTLLKDEKAALYDCVLRLEKTIAAYSAVMDTLTDDEQEAYLNEDGDAFDMEKISEGLDELLASVQTPEIKKLEGYLKVIAKSNKKADKLAYIEKTKGVDWSAMTAGKDGTYNKSIVETRILSLRTSFHFEDESTEHKLMTVLSLADDEKALKREIKDRTLALELHTKEAIETLSDEQVLELLELKWIVPLCGELLTVPATLIQSFTAKIVSLTAKYEETLHHINTQISEAEASLGEMLADLRGDEYEMAAIRELQQMMTGHVGSECVESLHALCCDKMFARKEERVPKIRFGEFYGEWNHVKLSTFANRVTRKNTNLESDLPLTISANEGLIAQNTFFNSRIASANISGYYLVENGEFAYNKSYSKSYPFGVVKRLDKHKNGVLSTLYVVFGISSEVSSDYIVSYYETSNWYDDVNKIAVEGARNHGLLNISAEGFLGTNISIPQDIKEQQKIGDFFKTLDTLITLRTQQLAKLKSLKSSCLQKMFV